MKLTEKIKLRIPKFDNDFLLLIQNKINKKYIEYIKGHDKVYTENVICKIDKVSNDYRPQIEKIFENKINNQLMDIKN